MDLGKMIYQLTNDAISFLSSFNFLNNLKCHLFIVKIFFILTKNGVNENIILIILFLYTSLEVI